VNGRRRFAAIAALVVGAGLIGLTISPAGAQSSGGFDADAIASEVDPAVAVVNITLAGGRGQGVGTGIVITPDGEILTNNHVVENAGRIRVRIGGAGRSYMAEVLGYNAKEDVALLKVDGVSDLETVKTDETVSVGESVVALGNGGGETDGDAGATSGSVRAVGETIEIADTAGFQTLRNLIRVDASLEPGDSGGPLVDADGEVIGMNAAASSGGFRLRTGSGYAIPIRTALTIANQIRSGEGSGDTHVGERAFLGVSIQSARGGLRERGGTQSGAVVADVRSDSAADDAGIQAGDEIVSLAGKRIDSIDDLTSALAPHHPRDRVEVAWVDDGGERHTATITLSGPPA
jgi:S1-C subfamily serine protease